MTEQLQQLYLAGKTLEEVKQITHFSMRYIKTCYATISRHYLEGKMSESKMRLLQARALERNLFDNINAEQHKFETLRNAYARFTI